MASSPPTLVAADLARHAIVRHEFVHCLANDERTIRQLFGPWLLTTGLREAMNEAVDAADELAKACGLADRGELYGRGLLGRPTGAGVHLILLNRWYAASDVVSPKLESMHESMWADAQGFLAQLELPTWLADDLGNRFLGIMKAKFFGLAVADPPLAVAERSLAPKTRFEFQTDEREQLTDTLHRFRDQAAEFEQRLLDERRPQGRFPQKTMKSLRRNARWLFWHRCHGQSIRAIARRAFPADPSGARAKDVREGLRQAGQWLDLGANLLVVESLDESTEHQQVWPASPHPCVFEGDQIAVDRDGAPAAVGHGTLLIPEGGAGSSLA